MGIFSKIINEYFLTISNRKIRFLRLDISSLSFFGYNINKGWRLRQICDDTDKSIYKTFFVINFVITSNIKFRSLSKNYFFLML